MIQMTRVKLVNWHNFADDTIDFKTITYLIGVNAVGKTTIMDAIRYCITTNKDFNAAGNKKSGRTLQGSVHQKQRAENEYLRPGHTVSYIAIEFCDEQIKKHFVITARVESESPHQELKSVSQDWYLTKPGYTLEDLPFFISDKNGRRPSKKEEFRLDNKAMERAANQRDARKKICRQLGIGDADSLTGSKFNKVFQMGTSLEDITDIRMFIYTYILPEPEVHIEGLYKDMQELENLQLVLEESKKKAELLEQIMGEIGRAVTLDSRVKVYEALLAYAQWQAGTEKEKRMTDESSEIRLSLSVKAKQIEALQAKRSEADARLKEIQRQIGDDVNHQQMESLRHEYEAKKSEYDALKQQARRYDQAIDRIRSLCEALIKRSCLAETVEVPNADAEEYSGQFSVFRKALVSAGDLLDDSYAKLLNELSQIRLAISELSAKIKRLESGTMQYPKACEHVLSEINRAFSEKGIREKARPLCELLYMNDERWQDAVESYLNTQRFYILVSPEHYRLAKQIFVSLGDAVKDSGLIDTVSLAKRKADAEPDVPTLAKTVESENRYAKAYIEFRLGDIVCCDSADDLEKYRKSVTPDRLRYQGYVLQRMRKQEHFIGQNALKNQLEAARKEIVARQQESNGMENLKASLTSIRKEYHHIMEGEAIETASSMQGARRQAEELFVSIQEMSRRIKELEKNPLLQGMLNREAECRKACELADREYIDAAAEQKNLEDKLRTLQEKLAAIAGTIEEARLEFERVSITHAGYMDDMYREYAQLSGKRSAIAVIENERSQGLRQRRVNERDAFIRDHLVPLQRQFNAEYNYDYLTGLEGIDRFRDAYSALTKIEIEHHTEKLLQAQLRCKDRFRKEVLFRMKDDIERARRLFKELNRVMGKLSYGEESYEFLIDGSKDKELQIFYALIMDKDNRQIKDEPDLFSLMEGPASDVFESQIEEFMQRIMVDMEMRTQQELAGQKQTAYSVGAYADYRTYLDYDIIVSNAVTGKTARLSQVSGDGSGGENQAPFYVAICASLLQIYQQSDNCIQLILLDEAFNNMTSDRIRPMMEMFRTLGLQLVLIATPEKCTSIFPYCDITYSIIKQGARNSIRSFEAAAE